MGEFFKGWRRKTGVVTLVMACAAIVIWVRSLIVVDIIQFDSGRFTREDVASVHQHLLWGRIYEDGAVTKPSWRTVAVSVLKVSTFDAFMEMSRSTCSWRLCGFGGGESVVKHSDLGKSRFCYIPYWSIVVPLTLLSAYLILVKPRPAKHPAEST